MKYRKLLLFTLLVFNLNNIHAEQLENVLTDYDLVVDEDFEGEEPNEFSNNLTNSSFIQLSNFTDETGKNNEKLKVTYEGFEEGSRRVAINNKLPKSGTDNILSFEVTLDNNFQFVKGGKLLGLGPLKPITGGHESTKCGWSARVIFSKNGSLAIYIYAQDRNTKYGLHSSLSKTQLKLNRTYQVALRVKLNSTNKLNDGFAELYINNNLEGSVNKIRFRGSTEKESETSLFMFNTFHGGHYEGNAPKNAQDEYTNVHAYFDNIKLYARTPSKH